MVANRGRIYIDDKVKAVESKYMSLQSRVNSLCIRIDWLHKVGGVTDSFDADELYLLFVSGCAGLTLDAVVYENPDQFIPEIDRRLRNDLVRVGDTSTYTRQLQQDTATIKRILVKLKTLDTLEKFYLSEWLIEKLAELDATMNPKKQKQEFKNDQPQSH
jgi:hypothetical protein